VYGGYHDGKPGRHIGSMVANIGKEYYECFFSKTKPEFLSCATKLRLET
jgi:hypothetical protein